MTAADTGEEESRCLVCRPGLPLFVVGLVMFTLRTQGLGDGQLLYLLVLLDDLQFGLFGVLDDDCLRTGEGKKVPAEFADKSVAMCGTLYKEEFEAEWAKLHFYYKRNMVQSAIL